MKYAPFIDGLRAIAVSSVVLHHIGFPFASGGFIGVDVFFVISGFLIISQIVQGLEARSFSLSDFWARRVLRILPTYLLVIVCCAVIAPFVFVMPDEYEDFAKEVGLSAVMAVNQLFLSQQGYFDQDSQAKVLLHLWSLAVEEQFYIVAPLLLIGLWRVATAYRAAAIALLFAASLAGCIYWTDRYGNSNAAFYLMPLRAWEFIAGGALSLLVPYVRRSPAILADAFGLGGLAIILSTVWGFGATMPYPSFWAVLPVAGVCAVILAGISRPESTSARLLSLSPFVGLGLVSYALYLWHWPLLTFARLYRFGETSLLIDVLAGGIIPLLLAIATRYVVELPIQRWRRAQPSPVSWRTSRQGLTACVAIGLLGYASFAGFAASVDQVTANTASRSPIDDLEACRLNAMSDAGCANGAPIGLLLGDSHAGASAPALSAYAKESGVVLATGTVAACIPILDLKVFGMDESMRDRCNALRANVRRLLNGKALAPGFAILISNWPMYFAKESKYALGLEQADAPAVNREDVFVANLRHTIDFLLQSGTKRILVVGPVPLFERPAPGCVRRSDDLHLPRDKKCSVPRQEQNLRRDAVVKWLSESLSRYASENVRFIDPVGSFCDDSICRSYTADTVLYVDRGHLSDEGMKKVLSDFADDFHWAVRG